MHFCFRNQFCLCEGLHLTPGARQTTKTTENQFNEDVMGPTSEVVETPAQFEYSGSYGQMEYEQPMFQFQMTNGVITYYYDGWPVGAWVPTLHGDNPFCGDSVGQMAPGYLQYPPQLEWMNPYQW